MGSRQPRMAPKMSILPILTLTGRAARWWPSGVRECCSGWQAPILLSRLTALHTDCCCGASRARDRKSSGDPYSHFCKVQKGRSICKWEHLRMCMRVCVCVLGTRHVLENKKSLNSLNLPDWCSTCFRYDNYFTSLWMHDSDGCKRELLNEIFSHTHRVNWYHTDKSLMFILQDSSVMYTSVFLTGSTMTYGVDSTAIKLTHPDTMSPLVTLSIALLCCSHWGAGTSL